MYKMKKSKVLKRILSVFLAITIIFSSAYVGLGEVEFSGDFAVVAKASGTSFNEMLDRANALVNYEWIPSKRIYTWKGNKYNGKTYFEAGETVKGVPYTLFTSEVVSRSQCSLIDYKKVASSNYSTTKYCVSVSDTRTGPVYGSCCATFVAEVFGGSFVNSSGHPKTYNVGGIRNLGKTSYNVLAKNIIAGDAISDTNGDHVVWVGAVTDSSITIYECTPPISQKVVLSKSKYVNSSGYLVYGGKTYSVVTKSSEISYTKTLKVYFNANGGSIDSDTYKLSSNLIYKTSDSTKYYQPWVYNNKKTNGLVNYGTFGLYKTGYKFVGWGTSASGGTIYDQNDATLLPTDINPNVANGDCSTTLYAIWKPNELSVNYNANGGSIDSDTYKLSSNIVCNIADSSKVAQLWTYNNSKTAGLYNYNSMGLYKTGYTFAGWGTTASGDKIYSQSDDTLLPTTLNANIKNGDCTTTLYAIWVPNELSVYYNANGGSISSDTYKLTSNIVCNIADGSKVAQLWTYNNKKSAGLYNRKSMGLYKTGYTFAGWGTSSDGGTIFNQNDVDLLPATINKNLANGSCATTLYAIWEPNELSVYYNANGGSINSDTYKLSNGIVCNISDSSNLCQIWTYNNKKTNGLMNYSNTMGLYKPGHIFVGWGTTPEGATIFGQSDSELLPTDINPNIVNGDCSTTLYAIWKSEDEIHSYTIEDVITEPTCTNSGLKRFYCSEHSDCGMYKEIEIPATGHIYGEWETVLHSTCMTNGSQIKKCTCGDMVTESLEILEHNYSSEWSVDKEATCTEDGSKSHHCMNENCTEKADITVISAKGHDYSDWTITKYASCKEIGSREKSCACGDVFSEDIPLRDCTFSDVWTIDKAATCLEDGSKSYHCLVCDNKEEVTVISATGHNYLLENELDVHPHTTTHICSFCQDTVIEDHVISDCLECNFTITAVDSSSYKLVSYIGAETDVVIPATYKENTVTTISNGCFKGNTSIKSVDIADGINLIGSLAFMNCTSLKKVIIPASVTSIGTQAFYGFTGTIYCTRNSVAHEYAVANNINYVLISIMGTENTQIDYDNSLVFTNVRYSSEILEILGVSETATVIPIASHIFGNYELLGTGSILTVFDGNDYIGDFTLIVEGDLNGDSVVDVIDAALAQRYSAGFDEPTENEIYAANGCFSDEIDVVSYQNVVNQALAR